MPMELRRTWPSDPGGIRVSSKCREYSDCRGLDDATVTSLQDRRSAEHRMALKAEMNQLSISTSLEASPRVAAL